MTSTILALALSFAALSQPSAPTDPRALVDSAIAALQRSASIRDFRSLRLTGVQHEYILGNAERSEGPWRQMYSAFSELRDPKASILRRTDSQIGPTGEKGPERVTVLADSVVASRINGRETGLTRGTFEDMIDRVDGTPVRALLLASASSALKWDRTVQRYGLTFDVVSFPWRNGRMRIELNRETHLPDAIEVVRTYPDNFRWAPFGDVTIRTDYMNWTIQPSGIIWPLQERVSFNGQLLRDVQVASARLEKTPVSADSFVVSDSARMQFAASAPRDFSRFKLGMRGAPAELRPGIVRVPDFWSQTLVKQPDGVVIFEAHISASYLHELIGEAKRRWPTAPVKAIVMTSDPWAHVGGVREAIALGIPIYVRSSSIPYLTSLAKAPHALAPDSLARAPRAPKFIPVSGKTVIGRGENRIELYPVGGPYAERMLMAYFPDHKLLYGADLVFSNRLPNGQVDKGFVETPANDLRQAVAREKLVVETLFCVQNTAPVAWAVFVGGEP
ncbi:MAG TPA: hypothetical protein VIP11_11660 [Gemmatimonadaceae bacterium]